MRDVCMCVYDVCMLVFVWYVCAVCEVCGACDMCVYEYGECEYVVCVCV